MKTVLVGWELGGGRGHIERLKPLIAAYLQSGWMVVAAMRDIPLAKQIFADFETKFGSGLFSIVLAPGLPHFRRPDIAPNSLPEVLAQIGFADVDLLRPVVAAWRTLVAETRPDVIISDFAPSLNIAARGTVPIIAVGNGWAIPPDNLVLPPLIAAKNGAVNAARAGAKISICASALNGSAFAFERASDLLRGDLNYVCSIKQLDPYRAIRAEPLYWPIEVAVPKLDPTIKRHGGLICMPSGHPAVAKVAAAVISGSMPFIAFLGDDSPNLRNLTVSRQPIDFVEALPRTRIMIHHGGAGTATWCAVNRIPQLICPSDLEKVLIADAVVNAGFGLSFDPWVSVDKLAEMIDQLGRGEGSWGDSIQELRTCSPGDTLRDILSNSLANRR